MSFLLVSSPFFWIVALLVSVVVALTVEHKRWFPATATMTVTLSLVAIANDANPIRFALDHKILTIGLIVLYFIGAAAWSVWKWRFYCKDVRARFNDAKEEFCREEGLDPAQPIPERDNLKYYWLRVVKEKDIGQPVPRLNKVRIMIWMAYWPWSVGWTLLNNPLRHVFNALWRWLRSTYDAIATNAFAGTQEDLAPPSTPFPAPPTGAGGGNMDVEACPTPAPAAPRTSDRDAGEDADDVEGGTYVDPFTPPSSDGRGRAVSFPPRGESF